MREGQLPRVSARIFFFIIGDPRRPLSLYQPWDKPIERFFSTVCSKFSKWFESYTGTLTGSKTYAKRQKDVDGMLERGELLTMEEFFEAWTKWKNEKYHTREHRGLKDAGEKWITPISLFENGERYEKAAPPREYAAMLLMRADTARVTNQGINKFGTLYTDYELCHYVGKHVGIKWDIDDVTKLYVFDQEGRKIHLDTNKKTKVFYMRQGVNAYGFKIRATHMMLRTESKRREKRRIKAMVRKMREGKITRAAVVQAVNSWIGFARWASSYNLAKKIFAPYRFIKTEGEIPYGAISRNRQARRILQQRRNSQAAHKAVAA